MKHHARRFLRITLGMTFLLLGVAGLVLPVLQGILFLFIGIVLLAPDIPIFRRLLTQLEERFPRLAKRARRSRWWPNDDDAH